MTNQPYIVILTGGAGPHEPVGGAPVSLQIDVALERAGCNPEAIASDMLARHIAEEGWQAGYAEAAKLHRTVAAWVLDGADTAKRFAEFVTREIDPAYVTRARSPLDEVLTCLDEARHPVPKDEVPW